MAIPCSIGIFQPPFRLRRRWVVFLFFGFAFAIRKAIALAKVVKKIVNELSKIERRNSIRPVTSSLHPGIYKETTTRGKKPLLDSLRRSLYIQKPVSRAFNDTPGNIQIPLYMEYIPHFIPFFFQQTVRC